MHARIAPLNEMLKTLASSQVKFVDLYSRFTDARGLEKAKLFLFDLLHLSEAGYALEAELLLPLLKP